MSIRQYLSQNVKITKLVSIQNQRLNFQEDFCMENSKSFTFLHFLQINTTNLPPHSFVTIFMVFQTSVCDVTNLFHLIT